MLTKAERDLLSIIHPGRPINVSDAAAILGKPLSAVSGARTSLLGKGCVAQWVDFNDALRITKAGRKALSETP